MSKRSSPYKKIFKLNSAQATLHLADDKSAKLSNVYAQIRGQGHGAAILKEVTAYADKRGISLWLEVQRYGNPREGLDNEGLIRFYEKFGFEVLDHARWPVMMGRYPLERRTE